MKKKKLRRRLKITQEWLDKFQGALAEESIKLLQSVNANESLHAEIGAQELVIADLRAKVEKRWWCPWCCEERFTTASDLRLHEQTCGSNRNRWVPEPRPTGWSAVLGELDLGDIKGVVSIETITSAIRMLKYHARPVCIVCGASTADIATMCTHMRSVHAFDWGDAPQ